MASLDSDDDIPLHKLKKRNGAEGSDDDVAPSQSKKRKVSSDSGGEDVGEKKVKKKRKSTSKKEEKAKKKKKKKRKNGSKERNGEEKEEVPALKKQKVATVSASQSSEASVRKKKELSKLQRVDEAIKAFEWWTLDALSGGRVFESLEHNGVQFAPGYEAHGVQMLYDGKAVALTSEQEEVATYYASMPEDGPQLSESGGQREIFQKNFFGDFRAVLGTKHKIQKFEKCDFGPIRAHLERQKAAKKAASDAEKKEAKAQREFDQLKIGYALLDGRLQKVGNFRMEPPSLFRGRGKHPKTGTLKQRCMPEQVAINCGATNAPPRISNDILPGHAWGSIQHDDTVTWLSSWHENVMNQNKYVMLAANSSLKGKSDYAKFEKAQQLKGCIDSVRHNYRANLTSKDLRTAQLATTMWLIDVYALRVGGEKSEDEADTVGCCSLRVEHFTFPPNGGKDVELEFLGKDSMRFKQTIDFGAYAEYGERVFQNLLRFCKGKKVEEQVFDQVTPPELNAHLSSIMPGLTAKVFRTYNASETLQNELPDTELIKKMDNVGDQLVAYNEANRTVAILCNHQRTVSAALQSGLESLAENVDILKSQKRELQEWKKLARDDKVKKIPLHSGDDPMLEAQAAVDAAKQMKNSATSIEQKVQATEAYENAIQIRKEAKKKKQAQAHKFTKVPTVAEIEKRIANWSEKIKKAEIGLRNKNENKEVSLGTSKANYCDPRISVAWCKRCGVPVERIFPKTLLEKFAWAMTVGPDWRFDARPLSNNTLEDEDDD